MKKEAQIINLKEALETENWRVSSQKPRTKMGNRISMAEGGAYHSDLEKRDHQTLKAMAACGVIEELQREISFVITIFNAKGQPLDVGKYRADFVFFIRNNDSARIRCIWECKGYETVIYKIKRKMILHLYTGIHFYESRFSGVKLLNAPESESFLNRKK